MSDWSRAVVGEQKKGGKSTELLDFTSLQRGCAICKASCTSNAGGKPRSGRWSRPSQRHFRPRRRLSHDAYMCSAEQLPPTSSWPFLGASSYCYILTYMRARPGVRGMNGWLAVVFQIASGTLHIRRVRCSWITGKCSIVLICQYPYA